MGFDWVSFPLQTCINHIQIGRHPNPQDHNDLLMFRNKFFLANSFASPTSAFVIIRRSLDGFGSCNKTARRHVGIPCTRSAQSFAFATTTVVMVCKFAPFGYDASANNLFLSS